MKCFCQCPDFIFGVPKGKARFDFDTLNTKILTISSQSFGLLRTGNPAYLDYGLRSAVCSGLDISETGSIAMIFLEHCYNECKESKARGEPYMHSYHECHCSLHEITLRNVLLSRPLYSVSYGLLPFLFVIAHLLFHS